MERGLGSKHISCAIPVSEKEARILKFLNRQKHRYVLDVGCGVGVLSSLIRAYGLKVHAFDISPRLMKLAYERMLKEGLEADIAHLETLNLKTSDNIPAPKLWVGDAVKAINYISGPYAVILCTGGTLGFTHDPKRVLTLMMESLDAGGRLYLELENPRNTSVARESLRAFMKFQLAKGVGLCRRLFLRGLQKEKRPIQLSDDREVTVGVSQLPIAVIEELATESGCKVRLVVGPRWLRDLVGSSSEEASYIERALSRYAPFNRIARDIWIEIDRP